MTARHSPVASAPIESGASRMDRFIHYAGPVFCWAVALSPLMIGAALVWLLGFAIHGELEWAEWFFVVAFFASGLLGILGSVAIAHYKKNWWWLLITVATAGLICVTLLALSAVALVNMH